MNMETPRTDKAVKESNGQWSYALVDTCKQLERELAAVKQIMGELCESCGWAMRLPDQPCRCELERELAAKTEAFDRLNESLPKTKRLFTNALAETIIDNQLKLIKQLENDLILTKKGNQ